MIARIKKIVPQPVGADWHLGFIEMLPIIRRYARAAFRQLDQESQDDAAAEVVANALVAYVRLCELGKQHLAYPTVLARYAIAQFHEGRRVGSRINSRDVMSPASRHRGWVVRRMGDGDQSWLEATLDDNSTPIPDKVAFRCDFPAWLATQTPRMRQIAEALALGHSTGHVARQFQVSRGRISQIRSELQASWIAFHGE
jgi:hypothetical protein